MSLSAIVQLSKKYIALGMVWLLVLTSVAPSMVVRAEDAEADGPPVIEEVIAEVEEITVLLEDPIANVEEIQEIISDPEPEPEPTPEPEVVEEDGPPTQEEVDTITELIEDPVENSDEIQEILSDDPETSDQEQGTTDEDDGPPTQEEIDSALQEAEEIVDIVETVVAQSTDESADNSNEPTEDSTPIYGGGGGGGGSRLDEGVEPIEGMDDLAEDVRYAADLVDRLNSAGSSLEGLQAFQDSYFDEQEVITNDADVLGTSTTESFDPEPTTVTGNTLGEDTDDTIALDTASTTSSATVEGEQYLDQETEVNAEAHTGGHTVASDKDIATLKLTTGDAGVTSNEETKGNTSAYNVIYGGGDDWVQSSYGTDASNDNAGDDNILSASSNEVRELVAVHKNKAYVSTVKDLLSVTGDNLISAGRKCKGCILQTGRAKGKSTILNVINTTTYQNSGLFPVSLDVFGDIANGVANSVADEFVGDINVLDLLFEAFGRALDSPNAITSTARNDNTGDDSILTANARLDEDITVNQSDEGYIVNKINSVIRSGGNTISSGRETEDTKLTTGDVDVVNTVVNILNSFLYESKIGVLSINVFVPKKWTGNLIIPSAEQFASSVGNPTNTAASSDNTITGTDDSLNSALTITNSSLTDINESNADITQKINIEANSGDNTFLFTDELEKVKVTQGKTRALSSAVDLVNRNIIGMAFSHLFANVHADWKGGLVGVPQDARVEGTENSFVVASEASAFSDNPGIHASAENNTDGADDSVSQAVTEVNREVTLRTKGTGSIHNEFNIVGDSGNNTFTSRDGENIELETGDVNVANSVSNFMNNNFKFSRGLTVALNVFSEEWVGNVAYDEFSDLSVDVTLLTQQDEIRRGFKVDYEVSVVNAGTKNTDPTVVTINFDDYKLSVIDADGGSVSGNSISWNVPALTAGEEALFYPTFRVRSELSNGNHTIDVIGRIDFPDTHSANNNDRARFTVQVGRSTNPTGDSSDDSSNADTGSGDPSTTPDTSSDDQNGNSSNDTQDTNDSTQQDTNQPNDQPGDTSSGPSVPPTNPSSGSGGGGAIGGGTIDGDLEVEKFTTTSGPFSPGDTIEYNVVVKNPGNTPITGVVAYDSLESDYITVNDSWELDVVPPLEMATITYTVTVQADMPSGSYTNTAYASGFGRGNEPVRSSDTETTVEIINPSLPASTTSTSSSGSGGGGSAGGGSSTSDTTDAPEVDGPEFGVIEAFGGNSEDDEDTSENSVSSQGSDSGTAVLGAEDIADLEYSIGQEILTSSEINRHTSVVTPTAYAAEVPDAYQDAYEKALNSGSDLAYNVYPNFLHFDGMPEKELGGKSGLPGYVSMLRNWLFWLLLLMILIAGYISYREKQQRTMARNKRNFE